MISSGWFSIFSRALLNWSLVSRENSSDSLFSFYILVSCFDWVSCWSFNILFSLIKLVSSVPYSELWFNFLILEEDFTPWYDDFSAILVISFSYAGAKLKLLWEFRLHQRWATLLLTDFHLLYFYMTIEHTFASFFLQIERGSSLDDVAVGKTFCRNASSFLKIKSSLFQMPLQHSFWLFSSS